MSGHADQPMRVGHPDVIGELAEVLAEPVTTGGSYTDHDDFGFRMITYRMKEVYCTQGQNLPSLAARRRFNPLLMNPSSMAAIGVSEGDTVVVRSGYGEVQAIVEASEDLGPTTVALAFGWGGPDDDGVNVQHLIPDDEMFDSVTGLALQSAVPVTVLAATAAQPGR
jgi:anaerobic selenocysteine-containing dehydrogenase